MPKGGARDYIHFVSITHAFSITMSSSVLFNNAKWTQLPFMGLLQLAMQRPQGLHTAVPLALPQI